MSLIGRLREERGQTIPIVVVLMFAMLGMAAFVVDVGSWYVGKRQVQSAADAAALAGVQDLPGSAATATTDAQSYVGKNVSGATVTVTTPYSSDASKIAVTVTKNVSGVFGGMFGITSTAVTATAVAKHTATGPASAFFAADTSCSLTNGVNVSGNNITITGGSHSNGQYGVSGVNLSFGAIGYGGPNGCAANISGIHVTYTDGNPTSDPNKEPWPEDFSKSPPACTYSAPSFSWTGNNLTIPSGVYCATGNVTLSGNKISGNVTFIAGSFTISGNNLSLTPFAQGLAFYETGTSVLAVDGNNLGGGAIFAPNASVSLSGNNGSGSGYVEALDVTVSGNNWTFQGNGPSLSGTGGNALVQ